MMMMSLDIQQTHFDRSLSLEQKRLHTGGIHKVYLVQQGKSAGRIYAAEHTRFHSIVHTNRTETVCAAMSHDRALRGQR